MNTMVQEMSWGMAAQQEGTQSIELDISETVQISGGSPLIHHAPEFIGFAAAVVALIGTLRS